MEKLIIEYYQNLDSKKQTNAFYKEVESFGKNVQAAIEFGKQYLLKHYVKVIKEYPETLFENMTSMREVYEFLKKEIKDNNFVTYCIVAVPKSFDDFASFTFNNSTDKRNKTGEEKMHNFCSSWMITHAFDMEQYLIDSYYRKVIAAL